MSVNRVFVKHGYIPTPDTLDYLRSLAVDRVLVCGLQAETWYSQLDSRSLMPVFSQR